jgi:hypothetical protein
VSIPSGSDFGLFVSVQTILGYGRIIAATMKGPLKACFINPW